MNDTIPEAHEKRVRRSAKRQGLTLTKTRTRDPHALDYNRWTILDALTGRAVDGAELVTFDEAAQVIMTGAARA